MKELREFENLVEEAVKGNLDGILVGAENPNDYGEYEYICCDAMYDSMIAGLASLIIAQGASEKKAKSIVDKATKELIKDKALDAYPKDMHDNAKMWWVNYAKPIIKSHLVLTGELLF